MGVKGFVFGLFWNEFRKHVTPKFRDIITALILTVFLGIVCSWRPLGYLAFFIISLVLIYLVTRLVYLVKILLYFRRMKKKFDGVLKPITAVTDLLKK